MQLTLLHFHEELSTPSFLVFLLKPIDFVYKDVVPSIFTQFI